MNKEKKYRYCGIILIGGGSSWQQDWAKENDIGKVVVKATKQCKRDWKHLFNLRNQVLSVNVYDITNLKDGWYFDLCSGMKCNKTNQEINLLKTVYAV